MSNKNSEELFEQLQAGDKLALKELFSIHYQDVCRAIHRFIMDKALVEDMAQEVFLRFWEKRTQITIKTSVQAYLRRMAINEALAYLRKNKKYREEELTPNVNLGTDTGVEEQYLHSELEDNIKHAIDGLPPRCKAVFQLSRFEELSYKEIAEKMGISIKTVENQMGKALKILRKQLRSYLNLFL